MVLQVYSSLQEIYDTMVHLLHISVHYIIFNFFLLFFLNHVCKFDLRHLVRKGGKGGGGGGDDGGGGGRGGVYERSY